jgi:predicted nucleic acid-binding Zn ribbon protein
MPQYDWTCSKCGVKTMVSCRISERDNPPVFTEYEQEQTCEHEWRRLLTIGGFALQGGGWAKDGYSSGLKVISS